MARKTRRRYYRRRGVWSSNIAEITENNNLNITTGGEFNFYTQLVRNPVQNVNSVSQLFTVKNVEATFELSTVGEFSSEDRYSLENLTAYIVYLPQGMAINNELIKNHPEYIMAYRYIGSPMHDENIYRNPLRVKTRLARKLNTGDSILLYIKGYNQDTEGVFDYRLNINGVVRWWTKAN